MPTVSVACKIPNGLILRLFDLVDHDEPIMGGGFKTVKRAVQKGGTVTLLGPTAPFGQTPKVPVISGYAINHGVDAEFWAAWKDQNKDHDALKNGLLFGYEKPESAEAKARNGGKVLSGLEPIVPDADKRIPRGTSNLAAVGTDKAA